MGTTEEGVGREGKESAPNPTGVQERKPLSMMGSVYRSQEGAGLGRMTTQPSALTHHAHLQIPGSW